MTTQTAEIGALKDVGQMVMTIACVVPEDGLAHAMLPPDVGDLRWTCAQADVGCDWTASEAWTSPRDRVRLFCAHHGVSLPPAQPDHVRFEGRCTSAFSEQSHACGGHMAFPPDESTVE